MNTDVKTTVIEIAKALSQSNPLGNWTDEYFASACSGKIFSEKILQNFSSREIFLRHWAQESLVGLEENQFPHLNIVRNILRHFLSLEYKVFSEDFFPLEEV
jgi:hypothetical protein